jgi:hypothetical protein
MATEENISVIVGCRNRMEFLKKALPSWIRQDRIKEIIIVDWGSTIPVSSEMESLCNDKIKIYRVDNVDSWILSLALNFASKQAKYSLLLKLDADNILHDDFFDNHPLKSSDNIFYAGNWQIAKTDNEKHLNGILFVSNTVFANTGGYNEYIRTYGYDDTDLYCRLMNNGLSRKNILPAFVSHIQHGDDIRLHDKESSTKLEIRKNMYLSETIKWNSNILHTQYTNITNKIPQLNNVNLYTYEVCNINQNEPDNIVLEESLIKSILSILYEYGYTGNLLKHKSKEFLKDLYTKRDRPKLIIEPKNGLGNRLRALASAAVLAEKSNRILCVVWKKDMHFDAFFSDLFDESDILVSDSNIFNKKITCIEQCKPHPQPYPNATCEMPPVQQRLQTIGEIIKNIDLYNCADDICIESSCTIIHPLTSWSLERTWLKTKLIPKLHIQHTISMLSTQYDIKNCIGIHIRMGQTSKHHNYEKYFNWDINSQISILKNRKLSHYQFFMGEIEKIWKHDPTQKFFLCADNELIYNKFISKYPEMLDQNTSRILHYEKNSFDRSVNQLIGAVIDVYLLSKTKYVLGSLWSSFTELSLRFGCPYVRYSGKDFSKKVYGALMYNNSYNLGDNIQTLAVLQFITDKNSINDIYWVDRDNIGSGIYDIQGNKLYDLSNFPYVLQIIINGWFDGRLTNWPLSIKIIPLIISFHVNETKYILNDPKYKKLITEMNDTSFFDSEDKLEYFYENSPIGCRDEHTVGLFNKFNIPTFYSNCLTLTFKRNPNIVRTDKILVVDSHILFPEFLNKKIPKHILNKVQYRSQALSIKVPNDQKIIMSQKLLNEYQECKFVITSRLHCAFPCLAFGIPVIFIYQNILEDARFDTTIVKILGLDSNGNLPDVIDWDNFKITNEQNDLIKSISQSLEKRIVKFLE